MAQEKTAKLPRLKTGVAGLDDVLFGGLPRNRMYLLQGDPGTGKTTIALQFLLEGLRAGEKGMYVTLSETAEELRAGAASHGWDLEGITIHELAREQQDGADSVNTFFHPSEVELGEATRPVLAAVEKVRPARVVFDSLSEMRLLAVEAIRYRRQILSLKQFFMGRECTVLLLDDRTDPAGDMQLQSLAHGVIELQQMSPEFGKERRRLRVAKVRGAKFRGGYHDLIISTGGVVVFPRLVASDHLKDFSASKAASGVPEFDSLVGGGLDRGTSTLLLGPAGSGKSSLAMQIALSAANRGERSAMFIFDERYRTLVARAASMGLPLGEQVDKGMITVQQVDPAELSPGEFAAHVCEAVESQGARVVIIDSLNGYLMATSQERILTTQLHELLSYLAQRGVVTLLVLAQYGLVGSMNTPVDVSYLADNVVLLRYFESEGTIRQAISVVKKRTGSHERTIREFQLTTKGVRVGAPLREFSGVLTGTPRYEGKTGKMLPSQQEPDNG